MIIVLLELKNYMQPQPRCLQIGTKPQRPPNVPAYLPPFPDPHTYIKTAVSENVHTMAYMQYTLLHAHFVCVMTSVLT